ncbi:hypothetical protein BpHYR1_013885, partial [Brachionus plicatilis]
MELTGPVSNSEDWTLLIETLFSKFGTTKPVCRTGNPYAREVDVVSVIRSLDGAYRKCLAEKDECISALKVEISELRSRVDVKERRQKEPIPSTSFNCSKIVSGNTHKDENAVTMITTITTEMKKKEERANNVFLAIPEAKLTEPNGEADFAKKLATDMGISGTKIKNTDPVLLVVELDTKEAKMEMVRKSRSLRQIAEYNDVY